MKYKDRIDRIRERLEARRPDPKYLAWAHDELERKLLAMPVEPLAPGDPIRLTPHQVAIVAQCKASQKLFAGVQIVEDPLYSGSIATAVARVLKSCPDGV